MSYWKDFVLPMKCLRRIFETETRNEQSVINVVDCKRLIKNRLDLEY